MTHQENVQNLEKHVLKSYKVYNILRNFILTVKCQKY